MTCDDIQGQNVIENYLSGDLPEVERDAFEAHYFECAACFGELQNHRLLRTALRQRAGAIRTERTERPQWLWMATVAAAALLVCALVWQTRPHAATISPALAVLNSSPTGPSLKPANEPPFMLLARVEPPIYAGAHLRGAGDDREFSAAMKLYSAGNYSGAIAGLQPLADSAAASFYLGISYAMSGEPAQAERAYRAVIAQGDTPYLEVARFYLAKALLVQQDAKGSASELRKVVALHGDREAEALLLLKQLPK